MSLSAFIETHIEALIDDWARHAASLHQGRSRLSFTELRDSARRILIEVAANMRKAQTAAQQEDKARGAKRELDQALDAVSVLHADDRLAQGFDLNEVIAEYRALRASVLRRWEPGPLAGPQALQEMIRFNEAIDQGITESVRQFSRRSERMRDLFAGALAHDLRSPLGVVLISAEILLRDDTLVPSSRHAAVYAQRSGLRIKRMIDDLLIFTRTRLGDAMPIDVSPQDMGRLCRDACDEIRQLFSEAVIDLNCTGQLGGTWDGGRLGQLLFNLLSNAARYGTGEIGVEVRGSDGWVTLTVSNPGQPIPAQALPTLFDPLTRADSVPRRAGIAAGIGLGLYICRCISTAHGGTIEVASDARGTRFTVRLPRDASSAAAEPPGGAAG
ncbi:sensor histidine kinase [Burkholderia glumae]|uniref:sensor histidine kinase n=1 Tax=Burkholderia glumae TaxID=337 RepID=UPI0003A7B328|nr:HAMP domain-containing sensor histidine kinase [Burkholderia glumae]MCM2493017.1 HAMP domain-containing histidine kinase [Burkholderia glumae]MCM2544294.1 HAMP domain-containing histidine kinase [Burkholderia glumae]MCM2548006.1 HAMP domain-containing histidine kinase [Burkholderia glumae]MCQ0034297.1 HAMP domain-containing histidine kinase [Burkholderia glumae]MCQ0038898.1 HAMP domain-containing histidine kinase [Burkholderia glumae]